MQLLQAHTLLSRAVMYVTATVRNIRSKKTVVLFSVFVFFFLYMASSYLLPAHRHFHVNQLHHREDTKTCLDKPLAKWKKIVAENDAVYKLIPESQVENQFFPFTGNSDISFAVQQTKEEFYLIVDNKPVLVPFVPVLDIKLVEKFTKKRQAVVLNIRAGSIIRLTSYDVVNVSAIIGRNSANKTCVIVEESFYVHRLHSRLFYHGVNIANNGLLPLTFHFTQQQPSSFQTTKHSTKTGPSETKYWSSKGLVDHPTDPKLSVNVTFTMQDYQNKVMVPQRSQNRVIFVSIVNYTNAVKPKKKEMRKRKSTYDSESQPIGLERFLDLLKISPDTLYKQHADAWDEIWKAGVRIDSENDPDSPSPLHVNLTEYYMYSTLPMNRSRTPLIESECYSGPPTIHDAALWVIPTNIKTLESLKAKWRQMFSNAHCLKKHEKVDLMLMREVMVFSFLGFQNKGSFIQLVLNPLNLQSNISIHGVSLHNLHTQDLLEFQINVNRESSERTLHVVCQGDHKPTLYGCATACEHVVTLGSSMLNFPVHTTDPVTPLFYISTNKTALELIGKTPFILEAKENAKASHQSHLQVHHMRLSPKFWLAVVVLIVTFHVIVVKMIYNECRKNNAGSRRRGQFS